MDSFSILLGKGIQKISKLRGGGGSALPGLVVEKTNPNFLRKTLSKLPYGVAVISGTNGKTTIATVIANSLGLHYRILNATTNNKKDMEIITSQMMKNDRLKKLLYYTTIKEVTIKCQKN